MMNSGLNIELYENVFDSPKEIFKRLEEEVKYLTSDLKVQIYGKSFPIPRQLAAYGEEGLSYKFSGLTTFCEPWTPTLLQIKELVESLSGETYNFVLVNRYKDGNSCIGQHKDNEKDLDLQSAITSVSFGQTRTMMFKKPGCENKSIELKDNSVLIMKPPTNQEWTHGIPRQKNCMDVRINLTFRKMATQAKRKACEELDNEKTKKSKMDPIKNEATFFEDDIPDTLFDLGDSVFLRVACYQGYTFVHVRRYNKYGNKFYPTQEGVTLQPWWIETIFGRKQVPQTQKDMPGGLFLPKDQIKIETSDFDNFSFSRFKTNPQGETISKFISITKTQWKNAIDMYQTISTLVADQYYRSLSFANIYSKLYDIEDDLPHSLDIELGKNFLTNELFRSFCKALGLQDPETLDGEVLANRICSFNNIALSFDLQELAHEFYDNLWKEQPFLALRPQMYVCIDFLKEVCLGKLLQQARDHFCPVNTSDFFEFLSI